MMDRAILETVRLLLETAPAVFDEPDFAMKGGTAINLFVLDMPRLSVDIDVVYTDFHRPREEALAAIASSLRKVQSRLTVRGIAAEIALGGAEESKLFVRRGNALVKIEVNHVFRGTVGEVVSSTLVERAQERFATEVTLPTLTEAELYGSKLVAAMDRQHPRDLFDVLGMFGGGGLTPAIVECFVCYLAGHNRPLHEVLFARHLKISAAFENEFRGLSEEPTSLEALLQVRDRLWKELPAALTDAQREFLSGLVAGQPDWALMRCPHLADLPAIRWKLNNLEKLKAANPAKFAEQARLLREKL